MTEETGYERNCEHVHEVWGPHEGCREFMTEPETFRCQELAKHWLAVKNFDQQGSWVESVNVCSEHFTQYVSDAVKPVGLQYAELVAFGKLERYERSEHGWVTR